MIGIGVKRTSGGGGITVTTNYLESYEDTLEPGFTCSSGRKYFATRAHIESLREQLTMAKLSSQTNIAVLLFDNTYAAITLAESEADFIELSLNEYQAFTHDYTI
jgi:hypothetical protein